MFDDVASILCTCPYFFHERLRDEVRDDDDDDRAERQYRDKVETQNIVFPHSLSVSFRF